MEMSFFIILCNVNKLLACKHFILILKFLSIAIQYHFIFVCIFMFVQLTNCVCFHYTITIISLMPTIKNVNSYSELKNIRNLNDLSSSVNKKVIRVLLYFILYYLIMIFVICAINH